jgi:nucleoside-diphosphate-sugar epimerase
MNVLIAGCGYLGEAAARALRESGHAIVPVTRSAGSARALESRGWQAVVCDLADPEAVPALPQCDAIVHCASSGRGGIESYRAVYLDGCRNLVSAFPGSFIVFISSTSVYAQTDGSWVDENSPAEPTRETSRILRESEGVVLAAGGAILRLAGLYGPGRSVLLRNFLLGEAQIDVPGDSTSSPLDTCAPQGRWINQIHRDDAATAIGHVMAARRAGIFNVADSTPLTQRQVYAELSRRFNKPLPPERPPATTRKRGWTNKRVSNSKLHAAGWREKFPSWFDALDHDPEFVPSIVSCLNSPPVDSPARRTERQ